MRLQNLENVKNNWKQKEKLCKSKKKQKKKEKKLLFLL